MYRPVRARWASGIVLTLVMLWVCTPCGAETAADPVAPAVTARAAVLVDASTGQILYDKHAHERRPPASTTKIMTALLALESCDPGRPVTVSSRAASTKGSSMHLRAGEVLTLEQLIYGALMRSGNDACVAIAEHVAGSESTFVMFMNIKAGFLGAVGTSFKNAHGLPATGHYSTAYDLALVTRYAFLNPIFCRAVRTRLLEIKGPGSWEHFLRNTNKLLWRYPWADGVKTGTTSEAGRCLVASATRDGRRLICVVLDSGDRFKDASLLLDYGFENFERLNAVRAGEVIDYFHVDGSRPERVPVVAERGIEVAVPRGEYGAIEKKVYLEKNPFAGVRRGERLGRLTVSVGGQMVGVIPLTAGCEVKKLRFYELVWRRLAESIF